HGVEHRDVLRDRERLQVRVQTAQKLLRVQDRFFAAKEQRLTVFADQRGQDRGHERGRRAVTSDVRQIQTRVAIVKREVVEEITAQELRRKKPPLKHHRPDAQLVARQELK